MRIAILLCALVTATAGLYSCYKEKYEPINHVEAGIDFTKPYNKELNGQSISVAQGWAQNSINAVVFRRNSVVSYNNNQYVAFYDANGYLTLAKRKLNSNTWTIHKTDYKGNIKDAHCSISIMIDGDGYLHLAWNHHNSKLLYCKSKKPESLDLSESTFMIGKNEELVTYPEFHKFPNGDLFFLYRDGTSGKGSLVINRYRISDQKWTRVHKRLIDGEKERNAYWQASTDDKGTFHISWVWRESSDVSSNHDMCYAKTTDFGETWQKSDGRQYNLPITKASAEYVSSIPENSNLINQTSMYADKNGIPYIATYYTAKEDSVTQFFLIYQDHDSWKTTQITQRVTPFSLQGGGTKKIPISRPQVVVNDKNDQTQVILIYRDIEFDNKIIIVKNLDADFTIWNTQLITDYSVESWEPTYDTELWKEYKKLHLFVQKVGQGDVETLENLPAQDVKIHEIEME